MMRREVDFIVIGGSAGAIDVLRHILSDLPPHPGPAMAIVVHLPSDAPSLLPEILSRPGGPLLKFAEDKEPIQAGTIYFATPDYHLLIEKGLTFALSQDEKTHHSRPAIDALFESAAEVFGDRVMGIILSGANADGADGLKAIAAAGGVAVVQSLESAELIAMPAAALEAVPHGIELDIAALAEYLRAHGRR